MKGNKTSIHRVGNDIKISDLAALAGVSKSTIHHYIKIGVLHPPRNKGLNYSVYDISHLIALDTIRELRQKNKLSLADIKPLLERLRKTGSFEVSFKQDISMMLSRFDADKKKKKAKKEEKRRLQIIDAATILFAKNGYEKTTLESIAESLRIAKSTVYLYFENKDALFLRCMDRLTYSVVPGRFWDVIQKEKDFFKRLKERAFAFHQVFPKYEGIMSLLKTALVSRHEETSEKAKKALYLMTKPIKEDIREGINTGIFKEVNEEILSHLILAMGEGLGFRLMMDHRFSMAEAIEIMFKFMEGGLLNQRPKREQASEMRVRGKVTDINGASTSLSNISFEKKDYLTAKIGNAKVKINLDKMTQLTVLNTGSVSEYRVRIVDGRSFQVEIDPSIRLSGVMSCGEYAVPLEKVSRITFL